MIRDTFVNDYFDRQVFLEGAKFGANETPNSLMDHWDGIKDRKGAKMNNPNIDRVWKERKELEDFRNIDRLSNYQLCYANGHAMPLFVTVKK